MKKEEALSMIQELQREVSIDNVRQQFWMDKVQGYVQFIFGDSTQSVALPMYGTYYWDRPYIRWTDDEAAVIVNKLRELFITYTAMIEKGAYFKKNITSNFTTPEIIIGMAAIVVAIAFGVGGITYSVGYSTGENRGECRLINCENQKERLRDSICSIPAPIQPPNHDTAKKNPIRQGDSLSPPKPAPVKTVKKK